jgi:hypothetical protein
MLHNALARCTANGMGFVLVGDPVQEVCSARRLARQALITLLMALALADAVLLGSFGKVDPLAHGNAGPLRADLNHPYTNASQAPGGTAPSLNHPVIGAHDHSRPKGLTR